MLLATGAVRRIEEAREAMRAASDLIEDMRDEIEELRRENKALKAALAESQMAVLEAAKE